MNKKVEVDGRVFISALFNVGKAEMNLWCGNLQNFGEQGEKKE